jgi:serine/threonine-protein kinase HipA
MRRRVERLGTRWDRLDPVDRLALVGAQGRGALVFAPATTPPAEAETLDLAALAAQSRAILLGEDAQLADTLATLGGHRAGRGPKCIWALAPMARSAWTMAKRRRVTKAGS